MNKQDILDCVEFELQLTKLRLKRKWTHEYTSTKVASGKSDATVGGVIKITDKHLESDDLEALTNDVRHQIAHLISGISHGHNFNWQFIANKLGVQSELIRLKAKEVEECKYCKQYTVLHASQMCHQCKSIHDHILLNENVAIEILHDIGAL